MSLRDGSKKMSKSDPSDYSRINLTDDADAIAQKVRKAKTDPEPLPSEEKGLDGRPEAENLVAIYAALTDGTVADVLRDHGGAQFSAFKAALVDVAVGEARADRRRDAPPDGRSRLYRFGPRGRLRSGRAPSRAPTMDAVKDIVGFVRALILERPAVRSSWPSTADRHASHGQHRLARRERAVERQDGDPSRPATGRNSWSWSTRRPNATAPCISRRGARAGSAPAC